MSGLEAGQGSELVFEKQAELVKDQVLTNICANRGLEGVYFGIRGLLKSIDENKTGSVIRLT